MALVTLDGHVARAIRFMRQDDLYIAIGRTTEWEDESNPEIPDIHDSIQDVVAAKKVETKILVVQDDEEGTIRYLDHMYRPVSLSEAYEEGARWVYCYTALEYSEVPVGISYRTIALVSGLQRAEGVPEAKYALYGEEIVDVGITEIIDNIQPVYRRANKKEKIGIIAEF